MKIQKKTAIKASTGDVVKSDYSEAISHIRTAIESLASNKDDSLAKDAIADLSVVLFELQ